MNTEKKSKVSKKLMFSWPTATISTGVAAAFVGYITFFPPIIWASTLSQPVWSLWCPRFLTASLTLSQVI